MHKPKRLNASTMRGSGFLKRNEGVQKQKETTRLTTKKADPQKRKTEIHFLFQNANQSPIVKAQNATRHE